ncbi:MAG: CRISPR-associated endoribonuclease Cas6 [Ruminococcaceae bacterium]|nr:CRISPR-associated endoribonuclease Cas6 [Oscillospiraceae bacterium]
MYTLRFRYMPDKTIALPLAHADVLQGIFYSLLSPGSALANEIHDKPLENGKQYKFFCFSDFQGKCFVHNGHIFYKDSFVWEIRAADERALEAVRANAETIDVKGVCCHLMDMERAERTCFTDSVEITMMTPLCVYTTRANGNRRFYSPEEEEFCRSAEKNLICKYEAFYGYKPGGAVCLEPIAVAPEDKCVTKYKGWYVTGYRGKYRLSAPPEVIDFAYHTGLGVKNSAGFGLFQF